MKTTMGKIAATGLATALCLSLSVPAFAADGGTYEAPSVGNGTHAATDSVTLAVQKAVAEHTYKVYQIFTGSVLTDDGSSALGNIKFGVNYAGEEAGASATDAYESLFGADGALAGKSGVEVAKYFAGSISGDAVASLTADNASVEVAPGYYLIMDESASSDENDVVSDYIITVVGDTTFTPKTAGAPDADKVILDDDGNVLNEDAFTDIAVGDTVSFALKATLPENLASFDTYKLVFQDTLTNLQLNADSFTLWVDGDRSETQVTPNIEDSAFTVTLDNVKDLGASAGSVVEIRYTATVTVDAADLTAQNTFSLVYSNDPKDPNGTGTTTTDKVTVFTFALDFDKVDGQSGDALAGAGFTLFVQGDGGWIPVGDENPGTENDGDGVQNDFVFAGLKAGTYKLVETTTPDGYNTMEDLEFRIVATAVEGEDGEGAVTELKIVDMDGTELDGWKATAESQTLTANIANNKGAVLPSSGGIGTTMFYAVGGAIVIAAGATLIVRRTRKSDR